MSVLREILAAFSIDVDDKALRDGDKAVGGFVKTLKDAGSAIAVAFGVTQIKGFIDGQLQAAGALRRSATTLGIGTQALQEYHLAAELAGVEQDSMNTGLRFLNRNLAEAAHGGAEQAKQFQSVGIAFKDASGHTRAAGDVMSELADKIAALQNPAERTELAMKLLGRGGAELIPVLAKGSAAFADARAEVKKLGGGMDDAFLAKAKEASHAQHELDFALVSLKTEIVGELVPAFASIVRTVTGWVVAIREATRGTHIFRDALEVFGVVAGVKTVQILVSLAKSLASVAVGAADAAVSFAADWAAVLLPVTAVAGAVDLLYYVLTGKSLHGVVWDWLFGNSNDTFADRLGASGAGGGALPGEATGKAEELGKANTAGVGENTRAARDTVRALHETTEALRLTADAFKAALPGFPVLFDRGAGARIEGIHVLRNDPTDPGPLGHTITPEGQALHQKAIRRGQTPAPSYVPEATRARSGGGADRAPHSLVVQNHFKTAVAIHTNSRDPKAHGKLAGDATANAQQRAASDAYNAWFKP